MEGNPGAVDGGSNSLVRRESSAIRNQFRTGPQHGGPEFASIVECCLGDQQSAVDLDFTGFERDSHGAPPMYIQSTLVGVDRFELSAPRPQTVCSARLSYTPTPFQPTAPQPNGEQFAAV